MLAKAAKARAKGRAKEDSASNVFHVRVFVFPIQETQIRVSCLGLSSDYLCLCFVVRRRSDTSTTIQSVGHGMLIET